MRKLLGIIFLLSGLAFGQATGNPVVSGHWPSVISYASLNQVAPPSTDAGWWWEVNHLDAAHGADHNVGILSRNPNFYMIEYRLLESVPQTGDADLSGLQTYCTSTLGVDYENAFLHYYDNTTTDLSACGQPSVSIQGWGGGSATSRSQARVQGCMWSSTRFVWNHADTTCLQPYMKYRMEQDVAVAVPGTTGHIRGAFWDEFGSVSNCSGSGCIWIVGNSSSGGHITEFSNETKTQIAADGKYETGLKSLLTAVNSDLVTYTSGDGVTYPNTASCMDTSCQNLGIASGGILTEFWDDEVIGSPVTSSLGTQYLWQFADPVIAAGKNLIWVENRWDAPTDHNYNACDHNSTASRHQMYVLGNYWQVYSTNRKVWYSQRPRGWENGPLEGYWYAGQEVDLGQPTGARASVQSGTTATGETFAIFRRNYTKGIVLSVVHNGYGSGAWNYDERVGTPISLGGNYQVVNGDGSLGPVITSIQPCFLESVALVQSDGAPPATTKTHKGGVRRGGRW